MTIVPTATAAQRLLLVRRLSRFGSTARRCISSSTSMQIEAYKEFSSNQFAAHDGCADMLAASIDRLATRIHFDNTSRKVHIADLGSADGTNSMRTLKSAVHHLRTSRRRTTTSMGGDSTPTLHVTFEDHPSSDGDALQQVLKGHGDWFTHNDVSYNILMKSFYEPLFEPESVDMMMSYICLHWLDTSEANGPDGVAAWKVTNTDVVDQAKFTCINEWTAPGHLVEEWRKSHAKCHLAKFFALRARELRPGAEAIVVMVGQPHQFVTPPDGKASSLTRAMQRCVQQGELREEILRRTIVPYYLRTVEDVKDAFNLAASVKIDAERDEEAYPGSLLELVDVRSYPTVTGGGQETLEGPFELFWSIHAGVVKLAGASEDELSCVKLETRRVFDELYDEGAGIPSTFVACVIRRRTRRPWTTQ